MKERDELLDRLGLQEATLIHYDIRRTNARARRALDRFRFGRVAVAGANGSSKTYRYPGIVDAGAEWVGQSVFLLEPDLADRLFAKLQDLRVLYRTKTVYVPR